ncbi:hypothetical protein I302_104584 [Kwoniella bestiolae CBS 10118]|uniref:Uncharacterized protein n=1 Tax=Kwoniella bestiolae CBS 10118 TaxID=1296100 RepID=A0A1B9GBN2_9TREE|nr:hypothetical protein I302_03290 [Kwoniella bestiolae CBS 10118]OCF28431.1 hypothetical protein I302_03290 [Kwoniella bestiolae CBS 10118]
MSSTTYLDDPSLNAHNEIAENPSLLLTHNLLGQFKDDLKERHAARTESKWKNIFQPLCHSHEHGHNHKKEFGEKHPKAYTTIFIGSVLALAGTWGYCMYELINSYGERSDRLSAECNSTTSRLWDDLQGYKKAWEGLKVDHPEWNLTDPTPRDEKSDESTVERRGMSASVSVEDAQTIVDHLVDMGLIDSESEAVWAEYKRDSKADQSGDSSSRFPVTFVA